MMRFYTNISTHFIKALALVRRRAVPYDHASGRRNPVRSASSVSATSSSDHHVLSVQQLRRLSIDLTEHPPMGPRKHVVRQRSI